MDERRLTVIGHLEELRKMVIVSLVALALAAIACAPLVSVILKLLKLPAAGLIEKLVYFSPEESFLIYMKISVLAGLLLAFPVIAYQFWKFIEPALEDRFKKNAAAFTAAATLAFAGGCIFAYRVLLPTALRFLLTIGKGELEPVISATKYISFVVGFMAACGAVFEMPVACYFLARVGLLNARAMRSKFKYAIVVICIAAAIITPTGDMFNMMMLAVPMLALYEVSIWVVFISRKRRARDAAEIVR